MLKRLITNPVNKITLLLLVVLVGTAALSGCATTRGAIARGWAGGVIEDGILYTGSMEGNLVAVNITDGRIVMSVPLETQEASSGGLLGCAPVSSAVAIYSSPVIADDLVYVCGYNSGKVYAISVSTRLSTDKLLKKDKEYSPHPLVGGPVVDGGIVYVGSSDGYIYALYTVSLDDVWSEPAKTESKIWSTPVVYEGTLYIGSFDKKLYAIDTTTGREKWEEPFETEGAIVSTPVVYNNTVYFGSFDRFLYAVNTTDGKLKWKSKNTAGNWFWAKPVVYNDTVYAACLDGKVYAFDAENGNKKDEPFDLGSPIVSSPVMVDGTLVVATEDGVIYTLDVGSSRLKDLTTLGESVFAPLIESGGKVYIHTNADVLYEVDALTGAKRPIDIKD